VNRASGARARTGPPEAVAMLPNLVTLLALACGLTAIREALAGNYRMVILLLVAEAILDGMDGRLARALGATSGMGEQLDSLCDAIGFGVAPAMVVYSLIHPHAHGGVGALAWFAALFYACTIVLRLARFNTLIDDHTLPLYHKEFFVGVPAPAAAWLVLAPVLAYQAFGHGWWSNIWVCSAWLLVVGVLAFSRLPTYSAKTVKVTKRFAPVLLLVAVVLIAGLFTFLYPTILIVLLVYLCHIPFAVRRFVWLSHHPEAWESVGYRIPRRHRGRPRFPRRASATPRTGRVRGGRGHRPSLH